MKYLIPLFAPANDEGSDLSDFQSDVTFEDAMSALDESEGVDFFDREDDADDSVEDIEAAGDSADDATAEEEPSTSDDANDEPTGEPDTPTLDLSVFEDALIPGSTVGSVEDVVEHLRSYRDSHETLEQFEAVVGADEALQSYLKDIQAGVDRRVAAASAFGDLTTAPDPDEDPEAYADWKANKAVIEERKRTEAKESERAQKQREAAAKQLVSNFKGTQERLGLDESETQRLFSFWKSMTEGDPVTGKHPARAFDVIYRGMQYADVEAQINTAVSKAERGDLKALAAEKSDHPMVAKVKTALRSAFTEGAKAPGKRRKDVETTPDLAGSRRPSGSENKELSEFASSLKTENWWDHPAIAG